MPLDWIWYDDPLLLKSYSKDLELLEALSAFISPSHSIDALIRQDLVTAFNMRWNDRVEEEMNNWTKRIFKGWYNTFTIPKPSGWSRQINDPHPSLKQIQKLLLPILRKIPVSIAVKWWEPKTNAKLNAVAHVNNRYMIAADVASAFPSVNPQRVRENIKWFIFKWLDISYSHFNQDKKEKFLDMIVSLVVSNDQLPQWAPTSTTLLNIVFAKVDKQIMSYAQTWNLEKPIYTRYVDDVTLSFRWFKNFFELWKISAHSIWQRIRNLAEWWISDIDVFQSKFIELQSIVSELNDKITTFNHTSEQTKLRELILKTKTIAESFRDSNFSRENKDVYDLSYRLIWTLNIILSKINTTSSVDLMELIKSQLYYIMSKNWWNVKHEKTKIFSPWDSIVREVTWVMIGHDWRLGISSEKMKAYINLAKTLASDNLDWIPSRYKDENWVVDSMRVAYALNWVRNFIKDVKWHVPDSFERPYKLARSKYFSGLMYSENRYSYDVVNLSL